MRITWCLPRDHAAGIGGYTIVYNYANHLSRRGHDVTVVHHDPITSARSVSDLKEWQRRVRKRPGAAYYPDPAVHRVTVPLLTRRRLAEQDAVIATAWWTAPVVASRAPAGRGFYFIQHYETWQGAAKDVDATWRLPLTRLVIAEWLADVARDLDALPVHHVPNAIDRDVYGPVVPAEQRPAARVAMLWHSLPWKRSEDGLEALRLARQDVPELTAVVFSRSARPSHMPDWVEWHEDASPREVAAILNSAAVFLNPSETEGWPLPPAEALSCSCALVSTDIPGVRDYAHEGRTALLVPVGDVPAMAAAVTRLVRDRPLRLALGRSGSELIGETFNWKAATDRLERVLAGSEDPAVTGGRGRTAGTGSEQQARVVEPDR